MTRCASVLVVSLLFSFAACDRSEDLGHLPDGGATGGAVGATGTGGAVGAAGQPGGGKGGGGGGGCGGQSCLQPLGAPCAAPGDCLSGFCVDKVCCNTACTGTGVACDVTGAVGTCTAAPAGLGPNGAACQAGTDCGSGFCAGGVCCNTACTGSCMSCTAAGTVGTCTAAASCP